MSDASKEPGEPVEDPRPVDDVVGSANEGLAGAEAAQRDIAPTSRGEDIDYALYESAAETPEETPDTTRGPETAEPTPDRGTDGTAADSPPSAPPTVVSPSEPASVPDGSDAPTTAYASSVPYVAPTATPQPIFVQAPEPPRPRGNRAAAGLIGLLAALSFAALYLAAALVFSLFDATHTLETLADATLAALASWWLWITTAVFFLGFWLLGAIINRGRWAHWVVWGLLVGFVAYGAHLVGQLFQAPFWQLTRSEGAELVETQLVSPLAFAAFVIGRELTIWFGAWIAARGRRVSEINNEAQREYERTLEAGPTLVRSAQG